MLLDLLSQSNYNRYNIKIAKILGLKTAIYIEELLDINDKAIRKDKIKTVQTELPFGTDNKIEKSIYFVVDREYIKERTTLTASEQKELDEKLLELHILRKSDLDTDELAIDISMLTSILMSSDEQLVKDISVLANKTKSKRTKQECISDALKASIKCEPLELRDAYHRWVDGVLANPKAFLSVAAIQIFMNKLDTFCNHNLDAALEILEICTVNGYREADWGINLYKKNHRIFTDKLDMDGYKL